MRGTRLGVGAALVDGAWLPGDVVLEDGRVRAVGWMGAAARGRGLAVPGLIDMQVNGYAGVDLMQADHAGYERAGRALLGAGTTAYLPTFVTAPRERLRAALAAMPPPGVTTGPRILGAHVEGPFISPGRMGAHDPRHRAAPDLRLLGELLTAGPVSRVTLAPELDGAGKLIDALRARGIVVAAGHTEATAAQAHAAFDRGVSTVTHLHNAMPAGSPREPSIVAAVLGREDVSVELIVDGHHLAEDTVLATWRAARGRLALVSDAVAAGGMPPGEFELGGRTVRAGADGAVRGADDQLSGTTLTLIEAVRNLHELGVPLEEALGAATAVPARVCGRRDLGRVTPGAVADVVVLGEDLRVKRVLVGGETVVES